MNRTYDTPIRPRILLVPRSIAVELYRIARQ
jgi:hypothetical protein